MSKYIIEIPDDVQYVLLNGKADHKYYTAVHPIAELEELNSDYINEHYGELQDEAYKRGYEDAERIWRAPSSDNEFYQKGFEDGKNSIENGCKGCKYEDQHGYDKPCNKCLHAHASHYTPMPKQDDRIEVGDEVIDKDGDMTIVTNIHERLFDGLCSDGSTMGDLFLEDVRKTGRHYDHIGKLLEAIRA